MSERAEIKQVSTIGAQGTQIGIQNVNVGMSAQEASQLTIKLFMENFPKLQEEANRIALERVEALCQKIMDKLAKENVQDFSPFGDPDVQYIVVDAEKRYARFGTTEMLDTLSSLICKRIQSDQDFTLKVSIDKAIEIAPMLTPAQFELLALLFFCKNGYLNNLTSLIEIQKRYATLFEQYSEADYNSISYLVMHGCLQIGLGSFGDFYQETLHFSREEIFSGCPEKIVNLARCDYKLSYTGIILALTYIEKKTGERIDPRIWID